MELFIIDLVEVTKLVLELSEEDRFPFLLGLGSLVVAYRRNLFLGFSGNINSV